MVAQKQKRAAPVHKKRVGLHHRQSKQYHKVYWPYVPMLLIVALGLFIGNYQPETKNGVLAYATEMSTNSLLDSTNDKRLANGKTSLKMNAQLTSAAQAKANDMTSKNYWSHNTPDGKEPWSFVQGSGYQYSKAGENLAYGFNSSKEAITGWMNSPSHRANLLDGSYSEVGFGFANAKDYNGAGPETVVVAMYGQPLGAAASSNAEVAGQAAPVNSTSPLTQEPQSLGVARIHAITAAPWALFAVGLGSGLMAAFVFLKHGLAFKKLAIEGEEFIIHHPFLDLALVTLIMTGYVLSQATGVIR